MKNTSISKFLSTILLIGLTVLMVIPAVSAIPPTEDKVVQAHGQSYEIWVALSWVYDHTFNRDYPFLENEDVRGPWQVTAKIDRGVAEFNAAVKTSEGIVKFELVEVNSVDFDGTILTIDGSIKEKYKGNYHIFEFGRIVVDLTTNEMILYLWYPTSANLWGTVTSGNSHP
jgi:hypothetical protein